MLPLVLLVPLVLVSLDLVVPWPSASGDGLLPELVPSGWAPDAELVPSGGAPDAEMSRRLSYYGAGYGYGYFPGHPQATLMDRLYTYGDGPYWYLASVVFVLTIMVSPWVFACRYKMKVTDNRPPLQDGVAPCARTNDFETSQFGCFEDGHTCMHALCCPVFRAADTYKGAGIEEYWGVVLTFILANIVAHIVGNIVDMIILYLIFLKCKDIIYYDRYSCMSSVIVPPFQVVTMAFMTVFVVLFLLRYRRKLRTKLGGNEEAGPNIFIDIIMFGCCTCCVIAQEARELDKAMGVNVECCCQLKTGQPLQDAQPLVGQPVQETFH